VRDHSADNIPTVYEALVNMAENDL
jgi:hypothetical protein